MHNYRLTQEILAMAVAEVFWIKVSDIMYTIRRFYPWPQPTQHSEKPGKCSPNTEACFGPPRRCGLGFTLLPYRHSATLATLNNSSADSTACPQHHRSRDRA